MRGSTWQLNCSSRLFSMLLASEQTPGSQTFPTRSFAVSNADIVATACFPYAAQDMDVTLGTDRYRSQPATVSNRMRIRAERIEEWFEPRGRAVRKLSIR